MNMTPLNGSNKIVVVGGGAQAQTECGCFVLNICARPLRYDRRERLPAHVAVLLLQCRAVGGETVEVERQLPRLCRPERAQHTENEHQSAGKARELPHASLRRELIEKAHEKGAAHHAEEPLS